MYIHRKFNKAISVILSMLLTLPFFISILKFFPLSRRNVQGMGDVSNTEVEVLSLEEYTNSVSSENKFLQYYFSNLTYNLGDNPEDAALCFYVALAMQLSYYDTWYNDNIIPDAKGYELSAILTGNDIYSVNDNGSSGINSMIPLDCYNNDTVNKTDMLLSYKSVDVDFMLNLTTDGYLYWGRWVPYDMGDWMAESGFYNVGLDSYFEIDSMVDNSESKQDEMRSFVISRVTVGTPVLVGIPGHATVAYAYDSVNDEIYLHNGYKLGNGYDNNGEDYPTFIGLGNNAIKYAMALQPTSELTHVCSDNYVYTDENGNNYEYCPCVLDYHPAHNAFAHTYSYTTISTDEGHIKTCFVCNHEQQTKHAWTYSYDANNIEAGHVQNCICGATVSISHYWICSPYESNPSEKQHYKTCSCGASIWEKHEFVYNYATENHSFSCYCGYSGYEDHKFYYFCIDNYHHLAVCRCIGGTESHQALPYIIDGEEVWICQKCDHPNYCLEDWDWELLDQIVSGEIEFP